MGQRQMTWRWQTCVCGCWLASNATFMASASTVYCLVRLPSPLCTCLAHLLAVIPLYCLLVGVEPGCWYLQNVLLVLVPAILLVV